MGEWLDPESNRGHEDFQSSALPTELSSRETILLGYWTGSGKFFDQGFDDPFREV